MRSVAVVAGALALWPSSALGAFPGRNGLLAVIPPNRHGIVLASAAGRVVRHFCPGTGVPFAGTPVVPRIICDRIAGVAWSSDGRELAVTAPSRFPDGEALAIMYADGSCLLCNGGSEPPDGVPAFIPSSLNVVTSSPVADGKREPVGLAGPFPSRRRLRLGAGSAQVTISARGRVAFVRARHAEPAVFVAAPDGVRRRFVTFGSQPAWSPDGRRLAYVLGGSVRVIVLRTGRSWTLARGTAPVWAPNGRELAFVSPGMTVGIVSARRGRARLLRGLPGVAVDWQPLVAGKPSCPMPQGATVLARGPAAEVFAVPVDRLGTTENYACLDAPVRLRALGVSYPGAQYGHRLIDFTFAGPYLAFEETDDYPPCYSENLWLEGLNLATGAGIGTLQVQNLSCTGAAAPVYDTLDRWLLSDGGTLVYLMQSVVRGYPSTTYWLIAPEGLLENNVLDSATVPSGQPPPIAGVALHGNTLTWTDGGVARQATLTSPSG